MLALAEKNSGAAFEVITKLREKSSDPKLFLELAVSLTRLSLFVKMGVSKDLVTQASEEDQKFMKDVAQKVDSKLLRALLGAFEYVGVSPIRELPLELAVLDIAGEKKEVGMFE